MTQLAAAAAEASDHPDQFSSGAGRVVARIVALGIGTLAATILSGVLVHYRPANAVVEVARAIGALGLLAVGASAPRLALLAVLIIAPVANPLPLRTAFGGFPLPLVALYAVALGRSLRSLVAPAPVRRIGAFPSLAIAWVVAGVLSGAITLLRYVEFHPFGDRPFLVLSVNTLLETNVHALRRVFEELAVFAAGPIFLAMIVAATRTRAHIVHLLGAVAAGMALSAAIGLYQVGVDPTLGATAHFVERGQINAGFIDPNALGACVLLALPMIAVLAVCVRSAIARVALAALGLACLVLLGHSGSRNGAAGVFGSFALGALLFLATSLRAAAPLPPGWTRRRLVAAAAVVLAVGSVALFFAGGTGTTLGARLGRTIGIVGERGVTGLFGAERWELWRRATVVIREYPASGIGLGAYITEIPTFLQWSADMPDYRDNAANYYLQVWAEMGAIGLALAGAVLAAAAWSAVRLATRPPRVGAAWHLLRCLQASTILSMILLYVTGPHTGHAEVQLLFWAMMGATLARLEDDPATTVVPSATSRRAALAIAALAALLVVSLGALQWRGAVGPLAVLERQLDHALPRAEGFGPLERDAAGATWHWIGGEAFLIVPRRMRSIRAELVATHPDLAERPVTMSVLIDGVPVQAILFDRPGEVVPLEIRLPRSRRRGASIRYLVDRVWVPVEFDPASADRRDLGVMIHAATARHPVVVTCEPTGGGTITVDAPPARDGTYHHGARLTATARAANGFVFAGWTTPLRGGDATIAFEVTRRLRVTARFVPNRTPREQLENALLGRAEPGPEMDVNGDGRVDAADLVALVDGHGGPAPSP